MEDITHKVDPAKFFRQLGDVLDHHNDNVDAFLKTIFTFVNTKTDYFQSVSDPRVPVIKALQEAKVKKRSTAVPTKTDSVPSEIIENDV